MQMERWLRERKDLDPSGKTATRNWPLKINFPDAETKRRKQVVQNQKPPLGERGLLLGAATPQKAALSPAELLPPAAQSQLHVAQESFQTGTSASRAPAFKHRATALIFFFIYRCCEDFYK